MLPWFTHKQYPSGAYNLAQELNTLTLEYTASKYKVTSMHVAVYVRIIILYVLCTYVVVQQPVNATVCQDDNATFTCVIFIQSGILTTPGWIRNGSVVVSMRHTVTNNLTDGVTAPIYISSTVTVSNVTVLDDEILYQCGILSFISSNSATLNVVGKCVHTSYVCHV